jgi:hypothetical protein
MNPLPDNPDRPAPAQALPHSGLALVPSQHHRPHHSLLALWHLLSLDAPTVATTWTVFIARAAHVALPWPEPVAMFVAVWMIYAADRLLDARLLDIDVRPNHDLESRHRFHHFHRNHFLPAILLSTPALVYLLTRIDARALHLYVLLATLLGVWMLLIHARPLSKGVTNTNRLPKELAVGLFFPAAIFIPTVARIPTLRPTLLPVAILFACVCTLNCLYLYAWEHPAPRLHAHLTTRWATAHLTQIATVILTVATLILSASIFTASITRLPALACALSAAALILLNAFRRRIIPVHLRAAADLALLTPLLLLPFTR